MFLDKDTKGEKSVRRWKGKGGVKKSRTVEWEIIDGEMEKGDELCTGRSCVEEVRWRER